MEFKLVKLPLSVVVFASNLGYCELLYPMHLWKKKSASKHSWKNNVPSVNERFYPGDWNRNNDHCTFTMSDPCPKSLVAGFRFNDYQYNLMLYQNFEEYEIVNSLWIRVLSGNSKNENPPSPPQRAFNVTPDEYVFFLIFACSFGLIFFIQVSPFYVKGQCLPSRANTYNQSSNYSD